MKNFEFLDTKLSFNKMKDYLYTADDVIGIQSTRYYAKAEKNLNFYTIAENEENYKIKVAELLKDFSSLIEKKEKITILELGGGTGKFCLYLTKYLNERSLNYEYTIVDISTNQYDDSIRNIPNLSIIEDSFTNFGTKNKKNFDILIMNEALDMWAGKQELLDPYTSEEQEKKPYWLLVDLEQKRYIKKKDTRKIKSDQEKQIIWQQVYYSKEKNTFVKEIEEEFINKIHLPENLENLLSMINLVCIIQDYWSFADDNNCLRMGLYEESIEKTLQEMKLITKEQITELKDLWNNELDKSKSIQKWIESPIIPFGLVDITYSPDQSELLDLSMSLNLELITSFAENPNTFDDKIYSVGERENEIFMLFTREALELKFKS